MRFLLCLALVLGCGDDDAAIDGGDSDSGASDSGVDATGSDAANRDGAVPVCNAPDTTCPEDQPIVGAPCEGALTCMYDAGRAFGMWEYNCEDRAWTAITPCSELPGGGCAPPPLAEQCRDAFMGTLSGATVQIGPAGGTFRPFMDGERIPVVLGGQGAAMIEMAVAVAGAEDIDCIDISIALSADGVSPPATRSWTVLDCGMTRRIFSILQFPELECGMGVHDLTIDVEVLGIGSTSATVEIEAGYLCFG